MDVREKLVELIFKSLCRHIHKSCKLAENIADDLIADGVTVQDNRKISDELLEQLRNAPVTILQEESTIEVMQEWISVKDRLPEESGMYIVTANDGHAQRVSFVQWQKKNRMWNLTEARSYWRVTHWMPLPEPPKGE